MKKIFNSRALALILVLAMAVSLLTISASAVTNVSLTGHGSNIASIVATGADFEEIDYAVSTDTHGTVYDYYLTVPADTADGTVLTATFTAAADQDSNFVISKLGQNIPNPPRGVILIRQNASNTYTATMTEGAALATAYAHKDVVNEFGKCDTYYFHYNLPYPVSISTGDPVFIGWSGNNGTISGRNGAAVIPPEFTLWVENPTSVTVNGTAQSYTVQNGTNYGYTIATSKTSALSIVVVANGTTYTLSCGTQTYSPAGTAPTKVTGYLPLGQFANNSAWGYLGTKFAGKESLDSTGVSLGAFGGFIEFYFAGGIEDDPKNPYGVDFVVYGNAFDGNPEAGAVQVGTVKVVNGEEVIDKWYELAGSNYYNGNFKYTSPTSGFSSVYSGTQRNTSVVYTPNTSESKVYASLANRTSVAFGPASWYPQTSQYMSSFTTRHDDGVVTASYSGSSLTFTGITAIADSNTNADYAFGYADVTPISGTTVYGNATNPYATSKSGGDGFDLAWAVDIETGLPVDLSGKTVKYVRVYSAVLDNGQFGETSTEVTGIFTTKNKAADSVNRTAAPTVKFGATAFLSTVATENGGVVDRTSVVAGKPYYVSVTSDAENIFINGIRATSGTTYTFTKTTESNQFVRIIVQDGSAAPYVTYLKIS